MAVLGQNNLEQINRTIVEAFNAGANVRQNVFQEVFHIVDATRKDEKYQIVKLDNTVSETTDGGAFTSSNITEIGGKTITQKIYKDSVNIGDFAEVFDNYDMIMSSAREKGGDYSYNMDSVAVGDWNNPTSSSAPYGFIVDGSSTASSLIGNSQPVGDTGATQDNNQAVAYSKTTLNNARILLRKMKKHNGNIAGYQPRMLLHPEELTSDIWEDVKSPVGPTSANNRNYVNSLGIKPVAWDLLTSSTQCFLLADKSMLKTRFVIGKRPTTKLIRQQSTDNFEFQIKAMYAAGIADYQGIVGLGA